MDRNFRKDFSHFLSGASDVSGPSFQKVVFIVHCPQLLVNQKSTSNSQSSLYYTITYIDLLEPCQPFINSKWKLQG